MDTLNLLKWMFDVSVILGLLWFAWQALFSGSPSLRSQSSDKEADDETSTGLFHSIVLFIAFGLLMSLAWVRLEAPDVALAEAAIGVGLTGALLLSALAKLKAQAKKQTDPGNKNENKIKHHD